jgi:hypothetical protein
VCVCVCMVCAAHRRLQARSVCTTHKKIQTLTSTLCICTTKNKNTDASEKSLAAAAFPHGTRQQACKKHDGSLGGEEMEAYARGREEQAGNKKKLGVEGSMHGTEKEKTACDLYFLSIGALVSRKLDLVPPVQKAVKVLSFCCSFPFVVPFQPSLPLPSLFLFVFQRELFCFSSVSVSLSSILCFCFCSVSVSLCCLLVPARARSL